MKKAELVSQLRLSKIPDLFVLVLYLNFLPNFSGSESNLALQLVQQKPMVLPLNCDVTPSLTALPLIGQVVLTGPAMAKPAVTRDTARNVKIVFMRCGEF